MKRHCVLAVFGDEPCRRLLRASVCYCTGLEDSDTYLKQKRMNNATVVEIFTDTEAEAMCYVRRINGGRMRYDRDNAALVECLEQEN